MKGDTLEYNTEHIVMEPNAVVEELLRQLPGLQVDAYGNIIYNGEKIQHLLVDGEDIFGSSPTLITRNFDASKIARIQILDRKNDEAIFTGVDDGVRVKTLNLVMKESAKNGYFGKIEAGGNTEGLYNTNGILAGFRDKEQFTALGMGSNLGVMSFSNGDGNSINHLGNNADGGGTSIGAGIPRFSAVALHYANSWNGPEDHVSANYQFSHYSTEPIASTQIIQTEKDSIYSQSQHTQSINQQDEHWLHVNYDWVPGAKSAFRCVLNGENSSGPNQFISTGMSSFNDTLVNSSRRMIKNNISRQAFGAGLEWRLQSGKNIERTFSLSSGFTKTTNTNNEFLYSLDKFYQPDGLVQSIDTVDQRKQITDHDLTFSTSLNFVNPLWQGATLALEYGLSYSNNTPFQGTFAQIDGKYQNPVDSLTSSFKTHIYDQSALISLQGKARHFMYTIAAEGHEFSYSQVDLLIDSTLRLRYINLAPRAIINYRPNSDIRLNFAYNASTFQPSVSQLAPTTNNNDPLHITLGSPNLKPGVIHKIKLGFSRIKNWIVNFNLNADLTSNGISTKTTTDSLGRQISQPVNVSGDKKGDVSFSFGRKVLGLDLGFHSNAIYEQSFNYVNAELSRNLTVVESGGLSLNKYVASKYSFQFNTNFGYFNQVSSINTAVPIHYWTQRQEGMATVYIIKNLEFGTNAIYTWQGRSGSFSSTVSTFVWNSHITRNLMHNKLVIVAQFNNILNVNNGITRSNSGNINTETYGNVLGRYWMFSAIYHFDHTFRKR